MTGASREELAWAAGFFDGEGYIGLSRRTITWQKRNAAGEKVSGKRNYWRRYPAITVAQASSPETLHRFNQAIGNLGKVRGPYGPYATQKKVSYQLAIVGFEKIQAVVAMLWEFLSSPKRKQAADTLSQYKEEEQNHKNAHN